MLAARVEQKNKETRDNKWRAPALTKKALCKPDAGNLLVRFDERGVETEPWWNH